MKQLLLLVFIFSISISLHAQFTVEPNPYEGTIQVDLNDYYVEAIAHTVVVNSSTQNINLRWVLKIIDAPAEWEYRVCDKNQCFNTGVLSNVAIAGPGPNQPVPLAPNDTTIMDLHIVPRGTAGCGNFKIELQETANPGVVLGEVLFNNVCVSNLTNVKEVERSSLRIFPNPTADFISLTKNNFVRQLWVSNILGKRVKTFYTSFNGKYDISDLPDGIYLVSMVDSNRKVIKTVRVSKRNSRP
jgi:hypothetical protein